VVEFLGFGEHIRRRRFGRTAGAKAGDWGDVPEEGRAMPEVFEQAQGAGTWVGRGFNVAPVRAIRDKLR
jgi:hypothetical protein